MEKKAYIIDSDGNVMIVNQDTLKINEQDIISMVGNESELEIVHQLGIQYIKQLEDGLMKALDEINQLSKDFDYYDKLRELTGFTNYDALDFLDMYSEN